jgi:hypothetical protein
MTTPATAGKDVDSEPLAQALAVLLVHIAGPDLLCVGCADLGRFALADCPAARQALNVAETHAASPWEPRRPLAARPAGAG